MNILDSIILIPIAIGLIWGLFRGLVKEVAGIVAVVLAIFAAKFFAPQLSEILIRFFSLSEKLWVNVLSWVIIFVAVMLIIIFLSKMVNKLISAVSLGWLNKLLGGVFGGLKFMLLISVLLNIFDTVDDKFNIIKPEIKNESVAYKPVKSVVATLWDFAATEQAPKGM